MLPELPFVTLISIKFFLPTIMLHNGILSPYHNSLHYWNYLTKFMSYLEFHYMILPEPYYLINDDNMIFLQLSPFGWNATLPNQKVLF